MKVGLLSLGCPKNLVDSEVMLGLAQEAGHTVTTDPRNAEVLIVNTCAFIDGAKQESIDAVLEMAQHKKSGACRLLVVTGCLAERYRDELCAQIPEIDVTLGTGEVPQIVDAISGVTRPLPFIPLTLVRPEARNALPGARGAPFPLGVPSAAAALGAPLAAAPRLRSSQQPQALPESRVLPTYLYDAETPRLRATPRHYAYIKIAEGCDYKCSFCIIPTLRGHYRSRPSASVVAEARRLAAAGVREIILISQDTTFYGIDRNERGALASLLRELNRLDGLEWIRLLYLYPTTITDETLIAMAECEKVCKYVDLPLQHVSERILKAMQRPGTHQTYERLLARIRAAVPDVALRTTFIVGFPGESDADFTELCDFVRNSAFDHVGVFTYSHEEGTPAISLADDIPARQKRRRRDRLMSLQKRVVERAQRARVGRRVRVLVDGTAQDHELVLRGRLETQAPEIDTMIYLTECDPEQFPAGTFVDAEIVGARGYDLVARPSRGVKTARMAVGVG